jgi:hypothetical protein
MLDIKGDDDGFVSASTFNNDCCFCYWLSIILLATLSLVMLLLMKNSVIFYRV